MPSLPFARLRLATVPLAAAALAAAPAPASAQSFRLGPPAGSAAGPMCTNATVPNTFGDVAGLVDFTYVGLRTGFGASLTASGSINGFLAGYGTQPCALWGTGFIPTLVAEIRIAPLGANTFLQLDQFVFGNYLATPLLASFQVWSDDFSTLLASGAQTMAPVTGNAVFAPGAVGSGPVRLQWQNPYYVGLGELRGTYGASATAVIPEPSTVVLLGAGLAGVVGAARRRRRAAG